MFGKIRQQLLRIRSLPLLLAVVLSSIIILSVGIVFAQYTGTLSIEGSAHFQYTNAPTLVLSNPSTNFSIFRGNTNFTPAQLTTRLTALSELDGDITPSIYRECSQNEISIPCPDSWREWEAGDYTMTYHVIDSLGRPSLPVVMNISIWNFIDIEFSMYHGVALGSDGSVWTWGANGDGQRGLGNTTSASNYPTPTQIPQSALGDLPAVSIAAGGNTSCAVNIAGVAYCWGAGGSGEIGNGSTSSVVSSPTAVLMPAGVSFKQISASKGTSNPGSFGAVGSDGNVYVWGSGTGYTLGTGNTSNRSSPIKITSTDDIVYASQGNRGGAAVTESGQVYVWGANNYGQLALGNTSAANATTSKPNLVAGITDVSRVSYGGYSNYGFIIALKTNGDVWGWGWGYGIRGSASPSSQTTPIQIAGVSDIRYINAAADFTHFVTGNQVYAVGYANYGELFGGNTTTRNTPTLSTLANVADNVGLIAGGYSNAFMLDKDGVMVWGIGYSSADNQSFGSNTWPAGSNSTNAVIPWTINTPVIES